MQYIIFLIQYNLYFIDNSIIVSIFLNTAIKNQILVRIPLVLQLTFLFGIFPIDEFFFFTFLWDLLDDLNQKAHYLCGCADHIHVFITSATV